MSKGLVHEDLVGDLKLSVYYDAESRDFEVIVLHTKTMQYKSDVFRSNYEPIFGIDVSDMDRIMMIGERLAVELENMAV